MPVLGESRCNEALFILLRRRGRTLSEVLLQAIGFYLHWLAVDLHHSPQVIQEQTPQVRTGQSFVLYYSLVQRRKEKAFFQFPPVTSSSDSLLKPTDDFLHKQSDRKKSQAH